MIPWASLNAVDDHLVIFSPYYVPSRASLTRAGDMSRSDDVMKL
jgi:hypothetical protein